jgi:UDP-3-O-[3-hydroxymyristoyl] glucosamine N-acyltransferase
MKLKDLAEQLGAECHGPADLEITGVAGIEDAGAGQLTFVANPRYTNFARTTQASAVLVEPGFPEISAATLRVENPYYAFAQAVDLFYCEPEYLPGIHPTAVIDPSAKLGQNIHIGAYVVVGKNVVLGDGTILLPHVVIYGGVKIGDNFFAHAHSIVREGCHIGNRVILQNGAVVGGDGFGFAKGDDGKWRKIPQSGPVFIGDDVEIQTNSCIDRASVGETRIGAGSKVDNLVQVGHGSSVGENTLLCAQVGIAGSSKIGNSVILAGQVGIAGHCSIGDNVVMTAQSGVSHDVPPGKMLSGSPAFENRQWLRAVACFERLPEIFRKIRLFTAFEKEMQNRKDME